MAIINIYHQKNFVILTTIYHTIYYRYTHIYNNCNISLSSHFKKRTKRRKKKFIMASKDKIVIYGHQASRASRPYWLLREYGMEIGEDFLEVDTGGPVTGFNDVRDIKLLFKKILFLGNFINFSTIIFNFSRGYSTAIRINVA